MATNMFKRYTSAKTREWDVPAGTKSNDLVIHAISGEVGVALSDRGDATREFKLSDDTTVSGVPSGGVSNKPNGTLVARDGSWLYSVAGVTNGETTLPAGAAGRGTPAGTAVYRDADGDLVLVEGENTFIGRIDDGNIVGGVAPIEIGVSA